MRSIDQEKLLDLIAYHDSWRRRIKGILEKIVAEEPIYNSEYEDLRHSLSRGLSDAWLSWLRVLNDDVTFAKVRSHVAASCPYPAQLPSVCAKISKAAFLTEAERASFFTLVEVLLPACEAIRDLKDKTLKGRPRKSDAPAPYQPPPASMADVAKVDRAVVETTQRLRDAMRDDFRQRMQADLDRYVKGRASARTRPYDFFTMRVGKYTFVDHDACRVVEHATEVTLGVWHVREDAEAVVASLAAAAADRVRDNYRRKMEAKLSAIVGERAKVSSLASVEIVSAEARAQTYTGVLKVSFVDGSGFEAHNSVVFSRSSLGKEFVRFPTTFRGVRGPGGRKIGNQSEKQMNEHFARMVQ